MATLKRRLAAERLIRARDLAREAEKAGRSTEVIRRAVTDADQAYRDATAAEQGRDRGGVRVALLLIGTAVAALTLGVLALAGVHPGVSAMRTSYPACVPEQGGGPTCLWDCATLACGTGTGVWLVYPDGRTERLH